MTRLADIVARRRSAARGSAPLSEVSPSTRDFQQYAHTGRGELSVIADLSRRTPFDPRRIGGETALTALAERLDEAEVDGAALGTELRAWGAGLDDLQAVSRTCPSLPLLQRDVILEAEDVWRARVHGADAVLLMPAVLDAGALRALAEACASVRMAAVAACWGLEHVARALGAGIRIVEADAVDLEEGTRDASRILRLAEAVPAHVTVLAAGLEVDEAEPLAGRVDGVILGRALVESEDPGALIRRLKEASHG